MQALMSQRRDPSLRAYWIWGPYLRADNEKTARETAGRYPAPSSVHYWTPTPKLATELASVLRFPVGPLAWDVYLLFGRGIMWEASFPRPTYWQHQLRILQGDPFDLNVLDGHILQALERR